MPVAMSAIRPVSRPAAHRAVVRPAIGLVMLTTLGACASRPAAETGLNKDLALADQLQRQSAPPLVTSPELAPMPTLDSVGATVGATVRPTSHVRALVRTRVITRTVTPAVTPAAHETSAPSADVVRAPSAGTGRGTSASEDAGTSEAGTYGAVDEPSAAGPGGGGYDASAPVSRQPQAHAARDGVFGSVAGAIIGAAASGHGNRVRGGLIGAVAGGALGAIYGGSVDRSIPTYAPAYASSFRRARAYRTY